MKTDELIELIQNFLKSEYIDDAHISFILSNKDEEYKAIVYRRRDPDEIFSVVVKDDEFALYDIYDWDFGIDTHLFEELKDGYEIFYLPLDGHLAIWTIIDNLRYDLSCEEGMQLYLKYCQKHEITPKLVSLMLGEQIDITDLYKESNSGYEIIASVDVASYSVVLGHKGSSPNQYVTWLTSPTRKNGYDLGHYFNSFDAAYHDFEQRSKELFSRFIESKKSRVRPQKVKEYER